MVIHFPLELFSLSLDAAGCQVHEDNALCCFLQGFYFTSFPGALEWRQHNAPEVYFCIHGLHISSH